MDLVQWTGIQFYYLSECIYINSDSDIQVWLDKTRQAGVNQIKKGVKIKLGDLCKDCTVNLCWFWDKVGTGN